MSAYGYEKALEVAGAEVLEFKYFGGYQGEWAARVKYQGEEGWVIAFYGSCGGCDSYEAAFGFIKEACSDHPYDNQKDCRGCQEMKRELDDRLAMFGRGYLTGLMSIQAAVEYANGWYEEELREFLLGHLHDGTTDSEE